MKKISAVLFIFSAIIFSFPTALHADSAFEGTQDTVSRTGFTFFGGQVSALAVGSTGTVYGGFNSPSGVFCSTDGAASWSSPAKGTDLGNIAALTLDRATGTVYVVGGIKVFKSTDTCLNWTEITNTAGFSDYAFAIVYAHSTLLVAARNGTVGRSTDNGATPLQSVTIDPSATYTQALAASPTAGEFYALVTIGSSKTLFKSTDSGVTWVSLNKSGSYRYVAVDPNDANHIILGADGDAERSTDGGMNWNTIDFQPPGIGRPGQYDPRFVNDRVYLGNLWTDDFATWHSTTQDATYDTVPLGFFTADPSNPAVFYASTNLGVAKSTDGGATFTDQVNGIRGVQINQISQTSDKNTVYIATGQGLARSVNFLAAGGPTWTFPFNPSAFSNSTLTSVLIDKNDQNVIYVGGASASIYRSVDNGSTWTKVYEDQLAGGRNVLDFEQTADGTLYAAVALSALASGYVLKSSDGITWTDNSSAFFQGHVRTLTSIGNVVFAGLGEDQDVGTAAQRGIWKYDGTSWTQVSGIPTDLIINDIKAAGNTIIAGSQTTSTNGDPTLANGSVLRSTDGGSTFSDVTANGLRTNAGFYRTVAFDPTNTNIVYAAHGRPAGFSEIYRSSDQGLSWSLIYTGLTDEVPSAMLVDDLITGYQTGAYQIKQDRVKITSKLIALTKKVQFKVTAPDRTPLKGKQVVVLVKAKPRSGRATANRAASFKKLKIGTTGSTGKNSGVVSFSLKNVKKGSQIYCTVIGQKSKTATYK